MKKSLLRFCCAVTAACTLFSASAFDFEVDGIYYNLLKNKQNVSVTFKDTQYSSYSGNVVIPETITVEGVKYTVTEVGKYGFRNCANMKSVQLPATLKAIQSGAFSKCNGLTSITLPDSVTSVGTLSIQDCPNLKEIKLGKGLQKIGGQAFLGDVALEKIEIPDFVNEIGGSAFSNCTSLVAFKVPASVEKLGNNVFQGCMSLKNIEVDANNPNYTSVDGVVMSKDKKTLYTYPAGRTDAEYTVPEGVTTLGFSCFCQRIIKVGATLMASEIQLEKVNLPQSLTTIGNSALEELKKMKSVIIPEGVTSIGNGSLRGCVSLESVEIPDATTKLDQYAFSGCTSLKSVVIGSGMATVAKNAFTNCTALTSVTCKATTPPECSKTPVFDEAVTASATLVVPKGYAEAYKAAAVWQEFKNVEERTFSGVSAVEVADVFPVAIYTIQGVRVSEPQTGVNIMKMSDGTIRKIVK